MNKFINFMRELNGFYIYFVVMILEGVLCSYFGLGIRSDWSCFYKRKK